MWTAVADGSTDVFSAGWLLVTYAIYGEEFEGEFEAVSISMGGVKIGIVVLSYMDIDSIEDLKE